MRLRADDLRLADGLGRFGLGEVGPTDRLEHLGDLLRLGGFEDQAIDHERLVVLKLREQGHPDRGANGLLGHRVAIIAVPAGEGDTAALSLVGPLGPGAGVTGPLLAEQFLARAGDIGAAAGVDRADPARGQVHQHHVVEELLVDLAAEIGRVDRFLADFFAGGVVNGTAAWLDMASV